MLSARKGHSSSTPGAHERCEQRPIRRVEQEAGDEAGGRGIGVQSLQNDTVHWSCGAIKHEVTSNPDHAGVEQHAADDLADQDQREGAHGDADHNTVADLAPGQLSQKDAQDGETREGEDGLRQGEATVGLDRMSIDALAAGSGLLASPLM